MIQIDNLTARYFTSPEPTLVNVSLTVPRHQTLVLLGGSGSGKSTVLKCLLRLLKPESGRIVIDGEDISLIDPVMLRRNIGMVFQGTGLFPNMTIRENIGIALKLAHAPKQEIRDRTDELLELIGLDPVQYGERYPHTLSGGQQQRVGVARALASKPAYLLMDEPFGALDAITRRVLQEEIKELREKLNITILFVTHDLMEAIVLGDEVAIMEEGRVVQKGAVQSLMRKPANDRVYDLVSRPLKDMQNFIFDYQLYDSDSFLRHYKRA